MAAFISNPALRKRGEELDKKLYGGGLGEDMAKEYRRKSPDIADMSTEWAIGGLIGRPGLDLRARELILVVLCAIIEGGATGKDAIIAHTQAALRVGATRREVYEALLMTIWYVGAGPAHNALNVLQDVFDEEFFATEFNDDEE